MKKELKKLSAVVILLMLSVMACKKDDADVPDLVGVWTITSVTSTGCNDASDNGTITMSCTSTNCLKVELKADGSYVGTTIEDGDTEIESGTYSISGDKLTIIGGGTNDEYTFSLSGDLLTIVLVEQTSGCTGTTTLARN